MLTATFLAYEKELESNIDHVFYLEPKLSLYVGFFPTLHITISGAYTYVGQHDIVAIIFINETKM